MIESDWIINTCYSICIFIILIIFYATSLEHVEELSLAMTLLHGQGLLILLWTSGCKWPRGQNTQTQAKLRCVYVDVTQVDEQWWKCGYGIFVDPCGSSINDCKWGSVGGTIAAKHLLSTCGNRRCCLSEGWPKAWAVSQSLNLFVSLWKWKINENGWKMDEHEGWPSNCRQSTAMLWLQIKHTSDYLTSGTSPLLRKRRRSYVASLQCKRTAFPSLDLAQILSTAAHWVFWVLSFTWALMKKGKQDDE